MKKLFLPALNLDNLKEVNNMRRENMELLRSYPVLILVTGDWAQYVSLDSYQRHKMHKHPIQPYDHFERLGALAKTAVSSEITKDYRLLEYHTTVSTYEAGPDHDWKITGVTFMLSEIVVIPTALNEHKLDCAMTYFSRTIRKTLRDSLLLAGGKRYKEETFEAKALSIKE